MVKLSLGGTSRPYKRKSYGKKKARRTKYAAISKSMFPRANLPIYRPLPTRMLMSFRCFNSQNLSIAAGSTGVLSTTSMFLPYLELIGTTGNARVWAGGLLSLMYNYGRVQVRKVQARATLTPYGLSDGNAVAFCIADVSSFVISYAQANSVTAAYYPDGFRALPNAHNYTLGTQNGGHDQINDYQSVDLEKFSGQPLTSDHSINKIYNDTPTTRVFSTPNKEESSTLPVYGLGITLASAVPTGQTYRVHVKYDWTFHIELNDLLDLPMLTNAAEFPQLVIMQRPDITD